MTPAVKRRLLIAAPHLRLTGRFFFTRCHVKYEVAVYRTAKGEHLAEIWRRAETTRHLWERLGSHPIDRPANQRALRRQVEEFL